jgi:hypothetical protein
MCQLMSTRRISSELSSSDSPDARGYRRRPVVDATLRTAKRLQTSNELPVEMVLQSVSFLTP